MGGNADQFRAQVRVVDPWQRVDRAAQRGKGVLDLVRDIGGECLDRVDPLAQRGGHVGDRPGQQADLVAPLRQPRHHHRAVPARSHPHRRADQQLQRLDDGARQEQRQLDRDHQRDADNDRQCLARVSDLVDDIAGVAGGQQDLVTLAIRDGGGNHRRAVGRAAQAHGRLAGLARLADFRPGIGRGNRRLDIVGHGRRSDQVVHRIVEKLCGLHRPRLAGGRGEREAGFVGYQEAVGQLASLGIIEPQPQHLLAADPRQQRLALAARGFGQRVSDDQGFGAGQLEAFRDQLLAIGIEVDHARPHQPEHDQVHREDAGGQRESAGPEQPVRAGPRVSLSFRQRNSLRRKASRFR